MDFHSLSRRELQVFCKRNKIPANMTNAAMADALKALEIVEGIEEFVQQSQSQSALSSTQMEGSEVTSPYVPPTTAGRSTRRRNVLKDDVEAVTSVMTRTRRTTRKTATEVSGESQVNTMDTPAVMAQASRRKVQMASACLKMDSQLKECMEEEKKDVLMTPAAVGATTQRRRVEETEKKVYSTRRSVRLAVKSVQMTNDVNSEESEVSKNELFAKDCEDQDMKEGMGECNEMSGITGVDAIENMEEKSEVVSAEKQDITITEEEMCIDVAVEVKPAEEICDNTEYTGDEDMAMPVNLSDEVQQSEGSVDACTSEIEVTVENSKEVNIEIGAGSQDEASDFVELAHLESKVDAVVPDDVVEEEVEDDKVIGRPEDVEDFNVTLDKLTELRLQPEELKQTESDEMETLQVEEDEKTVDEEPNTEEVAGNAVGGVDEDAPLHAASVEMAEQIPSLGADSRVVDQPTLMTGYSDNKENVGSGSEAVMMKERIKPAKSSGESENLHELSLRQLNKMFKEKLEITKKSSKLGNEALPRTALQALPENQ